MAFFFRISQATLRTLVRAIGLYLAYYLGFSVVLPLMLAFDAWSILPLWACMLLAALADFVRALILVVWFSDEANERTGSAKPAWTDPIIPFEGLAPVPAAGLKRRPVRGVVGANIGPRYRRQHFGRRQCWLARRSIGRR